MITRLADIPLLFPLVAAPLGRAYAHTGRTEEGLSSLQDAVQRAEDMEWAANHALRLVWLGEAYLRPGDESAARRLGAYARWSWPGGMESEATRPTSCGCSARSRRAAPRRISSRRASTIARGSRSRRRWACSRWRRLLASCLPSPR